MADTLLLDQPPVHDGAGCAAPTRAFYALLTLDEKPKWNPGKGENRYAVLVCARNEEAVLPPTA